MSQRIPTTLRASIRSWWPSRHDAILARTLAIWGLERRPQLPETTCTWRPRGRRRGGMGGTAQSTWHLALQSGGFGSGRLPIRSSRQRHLMTTGWLEHAGEASWQLALPAKPSCRSPRLKLRLSINYSWRRLTWTPQLFSFFFGFSVELSFEFGVLRCLSLYSAAPKRVESWDRRRLCTLPSFQPRKCPRRNRKQRHRWIVNFVILYWQFGYPLPLVSGRLRHVSVLLECAQKAS